MKWLISCFSDPGKRNLIILLAIAFLSLFPVLGLSPLFDEDEGFYAEASREMVENGNFLTAHVNGIPQYDKPILVYWIQSLSFRVWGMNEFAARFPSALATFLWMLAIYSFTRRHCGTSTAFLSALFFISAIQITITGKAAIIDSILNLVITLCMFHLYEYMQHRNSQIYKAAFYAGMAFLAKGPVAVAIPFGITLMYCLVQKQMRLWLRMVFNPLAILVFAIPAIPWYVLEYLDQGPVFIQDFFLKHNLERFSHSFEGHSGSVLYYIPVVIVGTLPHSGLLIPLLRQFRTLLKEDFFRFCLIWTGFVLILFSLGSTKLPHYILSAFPPLFILYATVYKRLDRLRIYVFPAVACLGILWIAPLAIPLVLPWVHDDFAACTMTSGLPLFGSGYYMVCGLLTVSAMMVCWGRISRDLIKTAVIISSAYLVLINAVLMPRIGELMQSPVLEAARIASRFPERVVMWGHSLQSFMFYSRKRVEMRTPVPGDLLLTKKNKLEEIGSHEILYEKNCIVLVRVLGSHQ